eukprot:TRINITY_DN13680_c0_g2_i4.p1 TRINITY_DN13680_c0_g2~~TRINITY_DN13680_c0_g2_i4.p1  ORF type:complete len:304 (-),score=46.97 TRINITY_DN13680_c0_g2_i4:123-1034(-)
MKVYVSGEIFIQTCLCIFPAICYIFLHTLAEIPNLYFDILWLNEFALQLAFYNILIIYPYNQIKSMKKCKGPVAGDCRWKRRKFTGKRIFRCEKVVSGRKGPWSKEEKEKFIEYMSKYGNLWGRISVCMGTRTAQQVTSHSQKYLEIVKRNKLLELRKQDLLQNTTFLVYKAFSNFAAIYKNGSYPQSHESKPNTDEHRDESTHNMGNINKREDSERSGGCLEECKEEMKEILSAEEYEKLFSEKFIPVEEQSLRLPELSSPNSLLQENFTNFPENNLTVLGESIFLRDFSYCSKCFIAELEK